MKIYFLTFVCLCSSYIFSQSFDCEILNYSTDIQFNGKKVIENISYEILINNRAGTKHAEISIPYSGNNEVKNLQAVIYNINGQEIRKLKKKDITVETPWSNINFHSDKRLLSFNLIHTSFPYILKYEYSYISNNFISLTHWTPYVKKDVNVKNASLTIVHPKNNTINLFEQNIDSAKITKDEETITYTWKVKDYKYNKAEPFSPHYLNNSPYVVAIPKHFHFGVKGESSTWKSFGNWECDLIDGLDNLTNEEKNKVLSITDTITSPREKIKALYHYLQDNTRYINVSLDIGGHVPHPATYVCTHKYGDCKALTNYMKAMLKAINIPSYYTTIYSGINPPWIKTDFPCEHANHVILSVPLKNDTIWLECTDKTAPFNYLGSSSQNRLCQLNKRNDTKLVRTPIHGLDGSLETYSTKISIRNHDDISFTSNGLLKGKLFEYFKGFDTYLTQSEKQDYIDETRLMRKADIKSINISRPHRDSAFVNINLSGKINTLTESLGSKVLLYPFKAISFEMTPIEKRTSDICVNYPINKKDTIIYEFESSISKVSGLTENEIVTDFGYYKRSYKIRDNKLIINRVFQLKQEEYHISRYNDFYNFIQKSCYLDQKKSIITFKPH